MASRKQTDQAIIQELLSRYGGTYAEEIGISVDQNTPAPLFQLLIAAQLFSTRIAATQAIKACHALFVQSKWSTPARMRDTGRKERVKVLNENGYARYDESTSRALGENLDILQDRFADDLRNLREEANHDPRREHELLQEFKGIGPVGADIFCREIQAVWDEHFPFLDKKANQAAKKLELSDDACGLSQHVARKDFTRLVDALVRCDLAGEIEAVRDAASAASRG